MLLKLNMLNSERFDKSDRLDALANQIDSMTL